MVRKVVAIEDEPEIAELLRVVLFSPELELHCADNGPDGLALVRTVRPDLVMLDVMLPGMNGWDVYDAIRADSDVGRVPVIMLSVLHEKPQRRRAFAGSEIDLYVTKPFDTLRLRAEIERLLKQRGLWQPPSALVAKAFGMAAQPLPDTAPEPPPPAEPPESLSAMQSGKPPELSPEPPPATPLEPSSEPAAATSTAAGTPPEQPAG